MSLGSCSARGGVFTERKIGFFARLSRPVDLTSGTPWRVIMRYAAPIIISYFLQQIYILTDAVICGQVLTASEVAGVNDTFPLTFIFLQFAFGCTAGFSVITAKCVGGRDIKLLYLSDVSFACDLGFSYGRFGAYAAVASRNNKRHSR